MPFLTTPTLSRDLPWMEGCPRIRHTSIMHAPEHNHAYITMQKAACSHLMDFFSHKDDNLTCGWDHLPGGKGNRGLGPKNRAVQSDTENN